MNSRCKHNGDYVYHKGYTVESAEKRFWDRVDKSGECWLWTGTTLSNGYGKLSYGGHGKEVSAHRFSFFLAHGSWPEPYCCHSCDNPGCVRPEHLFEGTAHDNNKDMTDKGRANRVGFPQQWKSTPELVAQIRNRYQAENLSMRELALDMGITPKQVESAIYKWKTI